MIFQTCVKETIEARIESFVSEIAEENPIDVGEVEGDSRF